LNNHRRREEYAIFPPDEEEMQWRRECAYEVLSEKSEYWWAAKIKPLVVKETSKPIERIPHAV